MTWPEFREPRKQMNGEEILSQDSPVKRYGAGILFPAGVTEQRQASNEAESTPKGTNDDLEPGPDDEFSEGPDADAEPRAPSRRGSADNTDEEDVNLANAWRPAAMGLTFLADFASEPEALTVEVAFATYRQRTVTVGHSPEAERKSKRDFWLRCPDDRPGLSFKAADLLRQEAPLRRPIPGHEGKLDLVVFARTHDLDPNGPKRFVTVCLVNRRERDGGRLDLLCYFQCGIRVRGSSGRPWIRPYPEARAVDSRPGSEAEVARLLFRDRKTFALGHGCAAAWSGERPDVVEEVWSDCLPAWELPPFSHDLNDAHGRPLKASMYKLAGLDPEDDGGTDLDRLAGAYRDWIASLEPVDSRSPHIPGDLHETARVVIERCRECSDRIEAGLAFLRSDGPHAARARKAFRLANEAMLISQLRSSREVRVPQMVDRRYHWDSPAPEADLQHRHPTKGYWRAFQVAFLLMSLRGTCDPEHEERAFVDLIWFPTGGGKTEAYLGLLAFTLFYHRLGGEPAAGCEVLMRYTLRLLTAQQFQRAGLLFCAMEHMRRSARHAGTLGDREFRLGMWVGGEATPNSRQRGRAALKQLGRDASSENPFVLLKCPWCHAKFGPLERGRRRPAQRVLGYQTATVGGAETVVFRCPDSRCEFGLDPTSPGKPHLPIVVIDEDLYAEPPDLLIGTVDKFAMLAWKPEVRRLFGLAPDGSRHGRPPSLIIQDELHLISGPLGSMVGAYEPLVEELCTDRTGDRALRPKIVASTATISRAEEQVRALYAREDVRLFPPSGLEAGDSFFAREDRDRSGRAKPGRMYVGVLAPSHGSPQISLSRVFAVLLQYPAIMPISEESERDPWWTLLTFFNSLRELGTAATLLVADARDYLRVILSRHGLPYSQIRQLFNWDELNSRVRSDKIPLAIQKLETPFKAGARGDDEAVDVCLASNIIEVGVDIDRLSLMAIVGQPKTTSQYIQVSSRIGRRQDAPGLVVVTYNPAKPRDRSHYERFRPFHQGLYAQVEPTSVTPFSPPAVERALPGLLVATARQFGPRSTADNPRPFPLELQTPLGRRARRVILERVAFADPGETEAVAHALQRRLAEWRAWNPKLYGTFGPPPEDPPLTHPAGTHNDPDWLGHSWPALMSLRNVDATCEAEITAYYNEPSEEEPQS